MTTGRGRQVDVCGRHHFTVCCDDASAGPKITKSSSGYVITDNDETTSIKIYELCIDGNAFLITQFKAGNYMEQIKVNQIFTQANFVTVPKKCNYIGVSNVTR